MADARRTKTDLRIILGRNIREARNEAGLTSSELAAAAGVEVRLLLKHMRGEAFPGPEKIQAYAERLGKPVEWFFADHTKKKRRAA